MKVRLIENHFQTQGAVPTPDVVGRREQLDELGFRLRSGQAVFVAGPRRIGKTSVLTKALAEASAEGLIPITLDLLRYSDPAAFGRALYEACLAHLNLPATILARLGMQQERMQVEVSYRAQLGPFFDLGVRLLQAGMDAEQVLDTALRMPGRLAEQKGRRVVLLLDEFQEGDKLDGARFYAKLRSFVTDQQQRVSYLFSGSRASMLRSLFADRHKPLYRAAVETAMPDPSPGEWVPYLRRKFEEVGIQAGDEVLGELLGATGGHPYDTMLVAARLHLAMYLRQEHFPQPEDAQQAVIRTVEELGSDFDAQWSELGGPDRLVLTRIAHGVAPFRGHARHSSEEQATTRAIRALRRNEFIVQDGRGAYRFREPLFAMHVARNMRAGT